MFLYLSFILFNCKSSGKDIEEGLRGPATSDEGAPAPPDPGVNPEKLWAGSPGVKFPDPIKGV